MNLRALPVFAGPLPAFDPSTAAPTPDEQFQSWLSEAIAAGVPEPHTMTLSTIAPDGLPDARVLILKDVSPAGWDFAGCKGALTAAALTFYWPLMGRQVRVRGKVLAASKAESAADFLARPPSSRAETLVGGQGQPLGSRAELDAAFDNALAKVVEDPELVAEDWTRYRLVPIAVEFFQADPDRKHIRLRYLRENDRWRAEERWP